MKWQWEDDRFFWSLVLDLKYWALEVDEAFYDAPIKWWSFGPFTLYRSGYGGCGCSNS